MRQALGDQEVATSARPSASVTIFQITDFLRRTGLRNPSRYLAQACLDVLLLLDDRVDLDNIQGFPLARYGAQYAQYWPTNGRVEGASSRINLKDRMECLFAS
jgi:hypothetical protein